MNASVSQRQIQSIVLAPQLRQGMKLLAMSLPELRRELLREMGENPVIDDVAPKDCEISYADAEFGSSATADVAGEGFAGESEGFNAADAAYVEGAGRGRVPDAAAAARRERFFDRQVAEESLETHLLRQLKESGLDAEDFSLAEMLVGELDEDGYFRGSVSEIAAVAGVSEERVRELLLRISLLDPPGCGGTNLRECLEPQLDAIGDEGLRERVRMLLGRLADVAAARIDDPEAVRALRSLNPRPGRGYSRSRYEPVSVRPEVWAVKCADGYRAVVDANGLPTIRISPKYVAMLEDPAVDAVTQAYVRERLRAVRGLIDAVEHRQETIIAIAQAIFDAQSAFFTQGEAGLRPLTMQEIADKVGVHHTTVSRTVRGKWAATPQGVVELRSFFISGVHTQSGGSASSAAVCAQIRKLVSDEAISCPLSDEAMAARLREQLGFAVARRTVAKYRRRLGIPPACRRKMR